MVRHNARKKKIWRKKFANVAAISRLKSVKNTTKGISEVVNHKRYGKEIPKDKLITNPYTGHQFVMTNPHPIYGEKYGIVVTGHNWIPVEEYSSKSGLLWEHKKHPQPSSYWEEIVDGKPKLIKSTSLHKDPKKMNRIEYMEKLVQYKLAKWERKHPKPDDELFNDVEQWKQERETALERFRDFVVSIYDKLQLTGRYKNGDHKFKEELVAELKDKDGEGHKVNELKPGESKLLDKAQKITNKAHAKNINLVATNLRDHKRQRGRIILPQAA